MTHREFMHEAASWMLRRALESNDYNVVHAAQSIGMSRSHFYRACAQHGIQVREPPVRAVLPSKLLAEFLGARCQPNS